MPNKKKEKQRRETLVRMFSVRSYAHLKKSKEQFLELIEEQQAKGYFDFGWPENNRIEPFYRAIERAFERAEIWLLYHQTVISGPTPVRKRQLLVRMVRDAKRLYQSLNNPFGKEPELGRSLDHLFFVTDGIGVAKQALEFLPQLTVALERILALSDQELGGVTRKDKSAGRRRGRPRGSSDIGRDAVLQEFMKAWENTFHEKPSLSKDNEGSATCPFCKFVHTYFDGARGFNASAIADRCREIRALGN